jgi:hypothetical protein
MKLAISLFLLPATLFQSGTAAFSSICQDDPKFRYERNDLWGCDWIAENDGCGLSTDNGNVIGHWYCLVTCGRCDREVTSTTTSTDQLCYPANEAVAISLENEHPEPEDWMGIYPESADAADLGDPIVWEWLCATPEEVCKVHYRTITFDRLPPGTYKAVLSRRNHGGPYSSFTETNTFEVTAPGGSCRERQRALTSNNDCVANSLQVDKTNYALGQEIVVTLDQCKAAPEDFIAIYEADTGLEDIKGDANYRLWMWTCGTAWCHEAKPSNTFAFGQETAPHTWPLPAGNYQAHLVKRLDDEGHFGSSGVSSIFTVEEETVSIQVVRTLSDCIDQITTQSSCYEEDGVISVILKKECSPLSPSDWIGFYNDEPNKQPDDYFFGDPLLWTRTCQEGEDCSAASSAYFNFKVRAEDKKSSLLPTGTYRVVLVGDGYRHGGPYKANVISDPFEVYATGEACPTKTKDSTQ